MADERMREAELVPGWSDWARGTVSVERIDLDRINDGDGPGEGSVYLLGQEEQALGETALAGRNVRDCLEDRNTPAATLGAAFRDDRFGIRPGSTPLGWVGSRDEEESGSYDEAAL